MHRVLTRDFKGVKPRCAPNSQLHALLEPKIVTKTEDLFVMALWFYFSKYEGVLGRLGKKTIPDWKGRPKELDMQTKKIQDQRTRNVAFPFHTFFCYCNV
jgi:hypothetical protein